MTLFSILSLLFVMLALAAMPSASVGLVVVRSATHGIRHGVAVAVGIVLGDLVFVTLAIVGMSSLAETMGALFAILRVAGGAYLIWVGVGLLRSSGVRVGSAPVSRRSTWFASLLAGLALTLGDVKAILFYASLFPAFVDMTRLTTADVVAIVAVTMISVGGVKLVYAFAARRLIKRFGGTPQAQVVPKVAGSLMVGAGSYLVVKL